MNGRSVMRFLKYSAVGSSTLLLDLALLYALTTSLGIPYYVSTAVAFLIAVSINYTISRALVFAGTERQWRHGYFYFACVAVAGAVLTTLLVVGLVQFFDINYLIARISVAGIIGIGNYLFNLYVNFRVVGKHGSNPQS